MEGYQSSGLANTEGVAGFVFENETDLMFSTKQLSLFIETNKPLYRQGQLGGNIDTEMWSFWSHLLHWLHRKLSLM